VADENFCGGLDCFWLYFGFCFVVVLDKAPLEKA